MTRLAGSQMSHTSFAPQSTQVIVLQTGIGKREDRTRRRHHDRRPFED